MRLTAPIEALPTILVLRPSPTGRRGHLAVVRTTTEQRKRNLEKTPRCRVPLTPIMAQNIVCRPQSPFPIKERVVDPKLLNRQQVLVMGDRFRKMVRIQHPLLVRPPRFDNNIEKVVRLLWADIVL